MNSSDRRRPSAEPVPDPVVSRIEEWKQKLIEKSRLNRLIYFRPSKFSHLIIERPSAGELYGRFVHGETCSFWMPRDTPVQRPLFAEPTDDDQPPNDGRLVLANPKVTRSALDSLRSSARSDMRERGVRTLYLAFGMLVWYEAGDAEPIESPLILCPAELKRESVLDRYRFDLSLSDDDEIVVNPAIQAVLKGQFGLKIPQPPSDWEELTLDSFLRLVQGEMNRPNWSTKAKAVLGRFSFYKHEMYADLDEHGDLVAAHPVIRALAGEPSEPRELAGIPSEAELDQVQRPEDTYQILDADGSQQQFIQAVLREHNLVLRGPPGTGKSQTIANTIAEFIARGKSVLFVSAKAPALDVVLKRLKDEQLGDFCLDLHDHKANKREVFRELCRCLTFAPATGALPAENEYRRLKDLRTKLNNYVIALHERRPPLDWSAYGVLDEMPKYKDLPDMPLGLMNAREISAESFHEMRESVYGLAALWGVVELGDAFAWRGCKQEAFSAAIKNEWLRRLDRLGHAADSLESQTRTIASQLGLPNPSCGRDARWIQELCGHLRTTPEIVADWLDRDDLQSLTQQATRIQQVAANHKSTRAELLSRHAEGFLALDPGVADRIEQTHATVMALMGSQDREFLAGKGSGLLEFAEKASALLGSILEASKGIESALGIAPSGVSPKRAFELAELASRCNVEPRPVLDWLTVPLLDEAREAAARSRATYEAHVARRTALLENYTEDVFSLQLDTLIEKLDSRWFRLPFCFLGAKKAIRRATRQMLFPANARADLVEARDLGNNARQLDRDADELRRLLGSYFCGLGTDFASIASALENSRRILDLSRRTSFSQQAAVMFCQQSPEQYGLRDLGTTLLQLLLAWSGGLSSWTGVIESSSIARPGMKIEDVPLADLIGWFENLLTPLREFCGLWRKAMGHSTSTLPVSVRSLLNDLRSLGRLNETERKLKGSEQRLARDYGQLFRQMDTDWPEILLALAWVSDFRRELDHGCLTSQMRIMILQRASPPPAATGLTELGVEYSSALQDAAGHFDPSTSALRVTDPKLVSFAVVREFVAKARDSVDDLQTWVRFKHARANAKSLRIDDFVDAAEQQLLPSDQLVPAFERSFRQAWLESLKEADRRLRDFLGEQHSRLIDEFKNLDRRLRALSYRRVIEKGRSVRPNGVLDIDNAEIGRLMWVNGQDRPRASLRQLLGQIPNLLTRLKPCIMMSPLSVSKYLPAEGVEFDVVVFDEASQLLTEDAIGAIYRGRQLVVAGDEMQLPPSDFWKAVADDVQDEDDSDENAIIAQRADFGSILEHAKAVLPGSELMLKLHYRSRHESLIAFSNHWFYNDDLVTFPSPRTTNEQLGVKLEYVPDGVYDRGKSKTNQIEAKRVAQLVLDHFRTHPDKSLLVVAFSLSQKDAIDNQLELTRRQCPDIEQFFDEERSESFMVQNLERVQGDERDVIIISVGYGFDDQHRLTRAFGPINKPGGERRLNVAITRAREKVVVVSSIRAGDIDTRGVTNEGVLTLWRYLDYAERGPAALELGTPWGREDTESPLEDDVARTIRSLGYETRYQIGCSGYRIDIGVLSPAQPGRFVLGVECDGATYHRSKTARERDRLRQEVLERLGWKIHRVWSTDWWYRRDREIVRLKKAIERAGEKE